MCSFLIVFRPFGIFGFARGSGRLGADGPAERWEFPKIRGTVYWGPYNKDPTI